jgi:hypothetical protein
MTLHAVTSFRGEVPLLTARALPENASQAAINARLYTGDLTAFRQFATTHGLANPGPVRTISLMASEFWLSWDTQVDVARGTVPGDTTFRTYLTGLDAPRFTNLALATTGPEPYPVTTRLLGVPPPDSIPSLVVGVDTTPTIFTVDIFDAGDELVTNWVTNSPITTSTSAIVTQGAGFYKVQYQENHNPGQEAYAFRNFGAQASTSLQFSADVLFTSDGSVRQAVLFAGTDSSGAGVSVMYLNGNLSIRNSLQWGAEFFESTLATVALTPLSANIYYTMKVNVILNADGTKTVTAEIDLGSGQLATLTTTGLFNADGGYCGFANGITNDGTPDFQTQYTNLLVLATGSLNITITEIATSYVYTFVNDLGEESAPSLPSATITRTDGTPVTVTTPTFVPSGISSDYFITTKRIYRAATGSTGTAFRFVAEIPLAQADYLDTIVDAALGEVLQSDLWALPPADLQGILALPNGVMVGFSKNQLCFSAQNFPHAWPVEYRLNTDTYIIGIGNIDTTVVIGTKSFVYVATGNDPANYSMSKFEVPHAASSKLSFAYITGLGVIFSGPQGLMVVAGVGQIRNLTQSVFTLHQWQALNPTSIVSVAHNDIYFMFWEAGSNRGCYAVDLRRDGFGVVEMAFHASAAYVDPIEDKMYLVLDYDNEPDNALLPIPPVLPAYVDARTIYQFEGSPTGLMTYSWRTKLWLEPYPSFHAIAQVRRGADAVGNLVILVYGDGTLLDEIVIADDGEFTLTPPAEAYQTFEMELIGTDTIRVLQAADDVTELG